MNIYKKFEFELSLRGEGGGMRKIVEHTFQNIQLFRTEKKYSREIAIAF